MSAVSPPTLHLFYPDPVSAEERAGAIPPGRPGRFVWTVRTFVHLSRLGVPCRLVDRIPDEGIVVTHRELLPTWLRPNERQLFVCVVADFYRHPFAQLHVVQNGLDPMLTGPSAAWPATYIPLWPEYDLVPRDPARGDALRNVSYFGLPQRLAPQLRGTRFATRMREEGFDFRVMPRERWHDYSDTDAVLAVRSFAPVSFHKFPPSKLYNSWLAGVPALLGRESAYRAERRSEHDYLEVRDADDVLRALQRLRDEPSLRADMARVGAKRAADITPEKMAARWMDFLLEDAVPAYLDWRMRSSASRAAYFATRLARYEAFTAGDIAGRGVRLVRKQLSAMVP
jgi:hypothetical protein